MHKLQGKPESAVNIHRRIFMLAARLTKPPQTSGGKLQVQNIIKLHQKRDLRWKKAV